MNLNLTPNEHCYVIELIETRIKQIESMNITKKSLFEDSFKHELVTLKNLNKKISEY